MSLSIQTEKKQLRATVLQQRNAISPLSRQEKSWKIAQFLLEFDLFRTASVIHSFLPLPQEPDTFPMIRYSWSLGKRVMIPYIKESGVLGHSLFEHFDELQQKQFGIWEGKKTQNQSMDFNNRNVVLVPGVAFDAQKNRLGFGKGYYDRFLAQCCSSSVCCIGLGFEYQIVSDVPVEKHDISLDYLLTEAGFI